MTFSTEWEKTYKKGSHLSVWPWSDLISLVKRNNCSKENLKVLELGCGAGANIPFFLNEKCDYHAIEGSKTIVERICKQYPDISQKIKLGDFTKEIPFDVNFDVIIDRGSLTCNNTNSIIRSVQLVKQKLKYKGKFIGVDWFSNEHPSYKNGISVDQYTKTNIKEGNIANLGEIHFSDKNHLIELFSDFRILYLQKKVRKNFIPHEEVISVMWDFVVGKEE